MTSPSIRSGHTGTAFSGTPTTWAVDFPSTVESGDTLVVVVACTSGAARTFTPPSGWSSEQKDTTSGGELTTEWFTKDTVTGSEDGGSDDWTVDSGANGSAYSFAISGGTGTLIFGTAAENAGSTTPDPPSLTHGLGSVDVLYLAFFGARDDDATVSAYPSGYSHMTAEQQSGGGANNSAELGLAALQATSASDDPGTFTLSQSENWLAQTVAMGPAAAAGPTLESTTTTSETAYTSSPSLDLPAAVDAGDHLLVVAAWNRWDGVLTLTSSGWTILYKTNLHGYHSWWILHKVADGTEDGGSVDWTTSGPWVKGGGNVLRFSGAHDGSVGVGVAIAHDSSRGYGTGPNPPEVTAPWGSADQSYVALQTSGNTGATVSAYPSGYGSGAQSSASGDVVVATAVLNETSTSDDPAAFTLNTNENYWSATVVIRPSGSTAAQTPTPSGGISVSGSTSVTFTSTGGAQVASDVELLVDWDNTGTFDTTGVEDITTYATSVELVVGRDYPSQITGRSTAGQLRFNTRNDDDRFSVFNSDSPLNTGLNSVQLGRRTRLQITDATAPEPTLLTYDRFGTAGTITETETAEPWAFVGSGGGWTAADGAAACSGDGMLIVDVRATEMYVQATWAHIDDSTVGIVYRYLDDDNYGVITIAGTTLQHTDVTAGSPTNHSSSTIERRTHMTIGVLVDADDNVTVYLEGVAMFTDTGDAHDGDGNAVGTGAGVYVDYDSQRAPEVEEIYVFDGLWGTSTGILFTGDLSSIAPTVVAGPDKIVQFDAAGWLTRLAGPEVLPPTSIGQTTASTAGVTSGLMVGAVLRSAGMLHPPPSGGLSDGIQLGGVGTGNAKALYVARLFETAEVGWLHELPEGPVTFDDRADRAAKSVVAAFSDDSSGQFGIETLEIVDQQRELFNRVTAEISPVAPELATTITTTGDHAAGATATITVTLPSGAQAAAGDLVVAQVIPTCQLADEPIEAPTGWKDLSPTSGTGSSIGHERWFARKLTAGDLSSSVTFYQASTTGGGAWIVRQHVITPWYGAIESGIELSEPAGTVSSEAQAGTVDPPTIFVPWGRQPTLFIVTRSGMYTSGSGSASGTDPDDAPNSYHDLDTDSVAASVSTADVASQYAWKHGVAAIESPSTFGGTFTGYDNVESSVVAVRGYAGSPPEDSTGELVTTEDLDSQAEHNIVSEFPEIAQFLPDSTAVAAHATEILDRHGDQRPIIRIGWTATRSALHRYLAYTAKPGDIVRVNLTGNSGVGVNALYHIESIHHTLSQGNTLWFVTYELSPVD